MGAQLAEVFPVRVLAADDGTPPSPLGGAPAPAAAAGAGAGAVAICGLRLPPDERGAASDRWAGGDRWAEEEAAALGAAAQFVVLAARFLRVRLRFGVRIGASRSWVVDAADAERGVGGAKGAAARHRARRVASLLRVARAASAAASRWPRASTAPLSRATSTSCSVPSSATRRPRRCRRRRPPPPLSD